MPQTIEQPRTVGALGAAQILGVSLRTLEYLLKNESQGFPKPMRVGRCGKLRKWLPEQIQEWLATKAAEVKG